MIDRSTDGAGAPKRRWARALGLGLVLSVVLTGLPIRLSAAEVASDETAGAGDERGAFGVFFDAGPHVIVQHAKGGVGTNFGVNSDKANILTNMTFRLGGGVKGPAIESVWGRPRPIAWAAALIPLNESATIGTRFVESVLAGSGGQRLDFSKFGIEYQTSGLVALGLEFSVPVFDSAISITPAIEGLFLESRYVGAVSLEIHRGLTNEAHALREKKELTQRFLGPALRIGAPTVVIRGVAIDFYLDTSLLLDVAGTRRVVGGTNQAGDSAEFSFETGSGLIQVGSGLQVRWP